MKIDMADRAARVALYDKIYRAGSVTHPRKGVLQPYGSHESRDQLFVDYLVKRAPPGGDPPPRVLDASCGRGHLAARLQSMGYEVEVSEVSEWLVDDLRRSFAAAHLATYAEIGALPAASFDAVLSNDVLEHLPKEEVEAALPALARLSRRFLMVSVGLGHGAMNYPEALGLGRVDLHLFCPGFRWWLEALGRLGRVAKIERTKRTLWVFVEVAP